MKRMIVVSMFVVTLMTAPGFTQEKFAETPIAALGQHIIARTYFAVDAQGKLTGRGTAALYMGFLTGMPDNLFSGEPRNEKTAHMTAIFSAFQVDNQVQNGDIVNTFFSAGHEVRFFYDSTPDQDWTNFDSFTDGEHVATFTTVRNLATAIGNVVFFINSAPLTFSKNFVFKDGKTYNFNRLVPGGITVHILGSNTPVADPANPSRPQVVVVSQLGGPAIMTPFSGTGIHQSPALELRRIIFPWLFF